MVRLFLLITTAPRWLTWIIWFFNRINFVFDTPSFSSFVPLKCNSPSAILLSWYKSESILKVSYSCWLSKCCLHSNSAFNLLFFSFVASINSISSSVKLLSTLFFANKISKFLIGSSNFHISSYSWSTWCSLIG